ncbi:hypothetical protein SGRA_1438 [Saprospira grandis str. Lewin]|uniref:Uncharacterized protein n=1 Tax=Saprospira grandis (strain Lewin) TaxID=984262 RepID=H6L7V2_SAPGL|nr:hypothetical protein SGRA_1438 [Saprospira grandis str. Lewin]
MVVKVLVLLPKLPYLKRAIWSKNKEEKLLC